MALLYVYLLTVLLAAGLFLTGCGVVETEPEENTETEVQEEESAISIGFSFDTFVLDRWLRDRDAFVATAEELGAETNVQNASGDVEEQIEQIRYLIRKQVDVLVVVATGLRGSLRCDDRGEGRRDQNHIL